MPRAMGIGFQMMGGARNASRARELKEDLRCCPSCLHALCVDEKSLDRGSRVCCMGVVLGRSTRRACRAAVVDGMMKDVAGQLMVAYRTAITRDADVCMRGRPKGYAYMRVMSAMMVLVSARPQMTSIRRRKICRRRDKTRVRPEYRMHVIRRLCYRSVLLQTMHTCYRSHHSYPHVVCVDNVRIALNVHPRAGSEVFHVSRSGIYRLGTDYVQYSTRPSGAAGERSTGPHASRGHVDCL